MAQDACALPVLASDGGTHRPYSPGMPLLLFLAFVIVPLVELWVIAQVAELLSLGPTLVLLLLDSVLGAVLVRREGARAWREFRDALEAGRIPGDEMIGGVLLLFGGALLLTPGFVTDAVGLALVIPLTRRPIARLVRLRAVPGAWQVGISGWNTTMPRDGGARPRDGRGDRSQRGDASRGGAGEAEGVEVLSVERDEPPRIEGGGDDEA